MIAFLRSLSPIDVLTAVVDIGVVAYVLYRIFLLIRGTRAIQLLKGVMMLLAATFISQWLGLKTVYWLLGKVTLGLAVALPIVFQPELRRALEHLGRGRIFRTDADPLQDDDQTSVVREILRAVEQLAKNKVGALIVLERETGLNDYVETGIRIDGTVSAEFLINIFIPNTPLHDGAVVVRGNRVLAAGCFLPLTEAQGLSTELGSRHRSALGITEHSDAIVVVVSEETGTVSLANAGKLIRHLDGKTLEEMLGTLLKPKGLNIHLFNRGAAS